MGTILPVFRIFHQYHHSPPSRTNVRRGHELNRLKAVINQFCFDVEWD